MAWEFRGSRFCVVPGPLAIDSPGASWLAHRSWSLSFLHLEYGNTSLGLCFLGFGLGLVAAIARHLHHSGSSHLLKGARARVAHFAAAVVFGQGVTAATECFFARWCQRDHTPFSHPCFQKHILRKPLFPGVRSMTCCRGCHTAYAVFGNRSFRAQHWQSPGEHAKDCLGDPDQYSKLCSRLVTTVATTHLQYSGNRR